LALAAAWCPLPACLACPAELLQQVAPGSVDAIVAIGGDGTMHEVLQVES
jgi:6-phosphofructokinase